MYCARSRKCILCTPLHVAFNGLRLTGRDNATNSKKSNNLDGGQILWFLSRIFLKYTAASLQGLDSTSGIASSITSGLTTYPANCVVAILSNSKTTSVCSRMLRTSDKRKMKLGFHVLLRSTLPNSCLAIPGTLAFQDRVYQSCSSFRWNMNNIPFLSRFFLKLGQCSLRFFVSWSS